MNGIRHRRKAHLAELIQQIRDLKIEIDQKQSEFLALSNGMDTFAAQYRQFVAELDREKHELESQIRRCRIDIRNLQNPREPERNSTPASVDQDDNSNSDTTGTNDQVEDTLQSSQHNTVDDEKTRIRRHFARFWHPDKRPRSGEGLMLKLNIAFHESQDAVDMMIFIPWHEAWIAADKCETWHSKLGRLTEWKLYLEEGLERLEQRLAQLYQDWRYSCYQEWDQKGRQTDFFATLATQEHREIHRLEQTLATLQQELNEMEPVSSLDGNADE